MQHSLVSCIVLCRNNYTALTRTVTSILSQRLPLPLQATPGWRCEVICIDSSDPPTARDCLNALIHREPERKQTFRLEYHYQYPPQGIYPAMNLGLSRAHGDWLIFMNSGDDFYDQNSLHSLIEGAHNYATRHGSWPRIVFGQALISAHEGKGPSWLLPDPSITKIEQWLRFFLPNHQAVLVDLQWARQHPFRLDAPQGADSAWLREAVAANSGFHYVKRPVSIFRLGGVSSRLPDWKTLRLRVAEPSRSKFEKAAELIKFFLQPMAPLYPHLMRMKSRHLARLFR
jgi:glycosyltransferase involved in cell wall biosynthesis